MTLMEATEAQMAAFKARFASMTPYDPTDGGQVSPPGFREAAEEMDAKWARGEFPIQRIVAEANNPDNPTDPGESPEDVTSPDYPEPPKTPSPEDIPA